MDMSADANSLCQVLIIACNHMGGELLAGALEKQNLCQVSVVRSSDALQTLAKNTVDVVVIASELSNQAQHSYDLVREVFNSHPDARIVIVADHTTQGDVINAFRAGACGIVSREQPLADLYDCIVQVSKGRLWASSKASRYLLDVLRNIPAVHPMRETYSSLTVREMQVIRLAAEGKTNKEIAMELSLSEHTVKNYLFKAFEKLGISSRVELLFSLTLGGQEPERLRAPERKKMPSSVGIRRSS